MLANVLYRFSDEAKHELKQFYCRLRNQYKGQTTPITARQLESIIRLCQARARCELRRVVTRADALLVIHLMQDSLYDLLADDRGIVDSKRSRGTSKSAHMTKFVQTLSIRARERSSDLFSYTEMLNIAQSMQLKQVERFDQFIDQLNDVGFLLKRGGGQYKLQSSI